MVTVRKSQVMDKINFSYLDSKYTFSPNSYQKKRHIEFGHLPVINEDQFEPTKKINSNNHRDVEITPIF
ncbi:MAG: hypothetical protein ACQZ3N_06915 [cyanobacterium endosymbiont of Rhopalodia yunnanensis]